MKSKSFTLLLSVFFTLSCMAQPTSEMKIAIISDIHIMAPQLLKQESASLLLEISFALNKLGGCLFTYLYPADNNLTIHTPYAY